MNEINFDDLEDKAEWDGSTVDNSLPVEAVAIPGFVEDCPKCRGTGTWRPGYRCFKCKGTGKLQFKTSPDQRAKGRKSAAKSKAKKDVDNKLAFWSGLTSSQAEWLKTNVEANSFAASLITAGEKYGHLTEGQSAAVYKAIARDDDAVNGFAAWVKDHEGVLEWLESEQAAGNEFAARLISAGNKWGSLTDGQLNCVLKNIDEGKGTNDKASAIDLSGLMKGFYAVPDGDTRLKIAVRRPGKKSRWFGWTFVDDGAAYGSRKTYGKQAPDGTYSGAIQDQLRTVLEDPKAAMIAYGKLTGTCGVCGRILEDEVSVANGIGPICAEKF